MRSVVSLCCTILVSSLLFLSSGFSASTACAQAFPDTVVFTPNHAPAMVGDTVQIGTIGFTGECPYAVAYSQFTLPPFFIPTGRPPLQVYVIPTQAGQFVDTVVVVGRHLDSASCTGDVSASIGLEQTVTADTGFYVRPLSWQIDLYPDTERGGWIGSTTPRIANKAPVGELLYWSLQPASLTLLGYRNGKQVGNYLMKGNETAVPLTFQVYGLQGSLTRDTAFDGELDFHTHSVVRAPVRYLFHAPQTSRSYYALSKAGVQLSDGVASDLTGLVSVQLLKRAWLDSISQVSMPFRVDLERVSDTLATLHVTCNAPTGGRYRDRVTLFMSALDMRHDTVHFEKQVTLDATISTSKDSVVWEHVATPGTGKLLAGLHGELFLSSASLSASLDSGVSWKTLAENSSCFTEDDAGYLYRGSGDSIFISEDHQTWRQIGALVAEAECGGSLQPVRFRPVLLEPGVGTVSALGVYSCNDGSVRRRVFYSRNRGAGWLPHSNDSTLLAIDSTGEPVTSVALDSVSALSLVTPGFWIANGDAMWASTSGGRSWSRVSTSDIRFNEMFRLASCLVAQTPDAGFLRSDDRGATWYGWNGGLPALNLAGATRLGARVYAVTASGELYRSILPLTQSVSTTRTTERACRDLFITPSTQPSGERWEGEWSVCDALGRTVLRGHDGGAELVLRAGELSAGVYWVKAKASEAPTRIVVQR